MAKFSEFPEIVPRATNSANRSTSKYFSRYESFIFANAYIASKTIAKTVLQERIQDSFADTIGAKGKSLESLEEKRSHAAEIRRWLAPWTLALSDAASGNMFRVDAVSKGRGIDAYRLSECGKSEDKQFASWAFVKQVLCSPVLVDITQNDVGPKKTR